MDIFDEVWQQLAKRGMCDELGGAEYKRVRSFWERVGLRVKLMQFINECANRPAPAAEDPPPSNTAP